MHPALCFKPFAHRPTLFQFLALKLELRLTTWTRLPFDSLGPRVNRGELIADRVPNSEFRIPASEFGSLRSMRCALCSMPYALYSMRYALCSMRFALFPPYIPETPL